jgi:hypothetical protein
LYHCPLVGIEASVRKNDDACAPDLTETSEGLVKWRDRKPRKQLGISESGQVAMNEQMVVEVDRSRLEPALRHRGPLYPSPQNAFVAERIGVLRAYILRLRCLRSIRLELVARCARLRLSIATLRASGSLGAAPSPVGGMGSEHGPLRVCGGSKPSRWPKADICAGISWTAARSH